jgi:hypothetical protein
MPVTSKIRRAFVPMGTTIAIRLPIRCTARKTMFKQVESQYEQSSSESRMRLEPVSSIVLMTCSSLGADTTSTSSVIRTIETSPISPISTTRGTSCYALPCRRQRQPTRLLEESNRDPQLRRYVSRQPLNTNYRLNRGRYLSRSSPSSRSVVRRRNVRRLELCAQDFSCSLKSLPACAYGSVRNRTTRPPSRQPMASQKQGPRKRRLQQRRPQSDKPRESDRAVRFGVDATLWAATARRLTVHGWAILIRA